ncbi:MAG TPA: ribonucleotide reductase N-terminal alpha domain-containing protein [Ktedonobacterales bacterium]
MAQAKGKEGSSATKREAAPPKRTQGTWSEPAERVLRERYLLKDERGQVVEGPDDLCWRVASAVAAPEAKWTAKSSRTASDAATRFYNLMVEHKFLPNSPTLMNAGKGNNLQLSACYVVPVEDSLEGIFEAVKHAALIHQSGGGTGFSFSRLRPEGSMVASTHGVASGPVSFMKIFDGATEAVKQGGTRRGANMGILRVDHPDILKFIDCKRDGSVTNFNISVAITDEFMRALEADDEYDLVDPHTKTVSTRLRARDVMDRIVSAAWATGDPGLVFIDRANRSPANPTPELELLEATNPCVVGETRLATSRGMIRMDTLYRSGEDLSVVTDTRAALDTDAVVVNGPARAVAAGVALHAAVPVFKTGTQVPVWRLTTSHGIEITATPSHRFLTPEGYKRLDELEFGDTLLLQSGEGGWSTERALPAVAYGVRSDARMRAKVARGEADPPTEWSTELGEVVGYVLGDGYVRRSDTCDVAGLAVDAQDTEIVELLQGRLRRWFGVAGNATQRQGHTQLTYEGTVGTFLMSVGLTATRAHEKRVPEAIWTAPRDAVIGFLRGLFSADGSVQAGSPEKGTCSVRLATSSKELARDVQQMLLNLGIVSAIRLRRQPSIHLLPNAGREATEYATRAQYEIIIDKTNRDAFAEVIGFMQQRKQRALTTWIANKKRASNHETFTTKVALIEDAGTADVYDTTEPVTHSIIVNGLATHQCGEQWLGPYDACNLGSINLGVFVKQGEIDWADLEETTRECTRFLDDVIEINPYPLAEVREKVTANRRIGLGIMGWADLLFKLGIRYDSCEATDLGERIMTSVRDWSTDESRVMAEERDAFANWEHSIYKNGPRLRNATRTTVAPTGSISILADCSSGIEPIFALAFQHRVKQPDGTYRVLDFVNPLFVEAIEGTDIPDKESVLAYVKEHGSLHGHPSADHPALLPFVTAHEIAPDWHIRMQAAFQKGVDNSISKTINLANSATYDDVRKAYMEAWELGCLGITVFRDGCKGEQVLNIGVKANEAAAAQAPSVNVESAPAVVASEASAPSQKRDGRYRNGMKIRPSVVHGYTRQVRAPEGKVNVTLNNDEDGLIEVFVNVGKAGSDVSALAEALGRLISIHLQIDSPLTQTARVAEVAHQLHGIGGSSSIGFGMDRVRSLPDAVARALEQHLSAPATTAAPTAAEDAPEAAPVSEQNGHYAAAANGHGPTTSARAGGTIPGTFALFTVTGNLCPQCGCNTLVYEEGCKKCHSCGHSEC